MVTHIGIFPFVQDDCNGENNSSCLAAVIGGGTPTAGVFWVKRFERYGWVECVGILHSVQDDDFRAEWKRTIGAGGTEFVGSFPFDKLRVRMTAKT
jgi:hypothetical protein